MRHRHAPVQGTFMYRNLMTFALAAALVTSTAPLDAAELSIFDAHVHYSHDAWESVPPADAVAILRKAGVTRALVSSSGDDGTQRMAVLAPDLILPSLRPYRTRGELSSWLRDETVVPYLEDRLRQYNYVAIGEFHVFGADADLPNVRRVVELAKRHGLVLHAHGDADAIERLFRHDPDARILWAHAGFERPETVRQMLRRYPTLWSDLAFRSEHGAGGKVDAAWQAAFDEFPERFMVGTDTFTPERWHYVGEHATWSRAWLASLPKPLAERIAFRNGEKLFSDAIAKRGL